MHSISHTRWLLLLPLLGTLAAAAQDRPARPGFDSTLKDYQPFADEKPVPWRQANDTVRDVGGWRQYAKEAAQQPKPADEKKADPHAGHGQQPKAKP
jgi:hypothetical protein